MEHILLELLRRLEVIGDRDESLFDTVVREKMSDPIFYLFIKPTPNYILPNDYGMSPEDNIEIQSALGDYIRSAVLFAKTLNPNTFHSRLAAFQNGEICTEQKNYFDDFFGWSDPNLFDEDGNVVPPKR